jgi:transcriptional regulator with XRE-family HTH domain
MTQQEITSLKATGGHPRVSINGKAIRQIRLANNLTIEDIARRANLGWQTVWRMEMKQVMASADTASRIAAALQIPVGVISPNWHIVTEE